MFRGIFVQLLQQKGLSARQFASEIGVSEQLAGQWKNGSQIPRSTNLQKIADYFGVTTAYLLGEESGRLVDQLSVEDIEILTLFRTLDDEGKVVVKAALYTQKHRVESKESTDNQ